MRNWSINEKNNASRPVRRPRLAPSVFFLVPVACLAASLIACEPPASPSPVEIPEGAGSAAGGTGGASPEGGQGGNPSQGAEAGQSVVYMPPDLGLGGALDLGSEGGEGGSNDDEAPPTCENKPFELERVPPDFLLVFDRSNSMTKPLPESGGSRWDAATEAVETTVQETNEKVNWGIKVFPNSEQNGCQVNEGSDVQVSPSNQANVVNLITSVQPYKGPGQNGSTPTADAVEKAFSYLQDVESELGRYLVWSRTGIQPAEATTAFQTLSQPLKRHVTKASTRSLSACRLPSARTRTTRAKQKAS